MGNSDFEQAMRQMGVRRLSDKPIRRPAVDRKQGLEPPAEAPLSGATSPEVSGATSAELAEEKGQSQSAEAHRLEAHRLEAHRLEGDLAKARSRILHLETEVADLKLKIQMIPEPVLNPKAGRVGRLLQERGVGPGDQAACFKALMDSGAFSKFLNQIEVVDECSFARFLDGQVYLHCGRPECKGPDAMAAIQVAPTRCEICGGSSDFACAEALSEQLLLNGVRTLYFRTQRLGLMLWFVRQLDPRITARVAPVDVTLALGTDSGPIVLWRIGNEAEGVDADFRIKASSIAQFVKRFGFKLDEK